MKFYSKTKTAQKLGFRTPDHFRAQNFAGPQKPPSSANWRTKFNPTRFRIQHKG